MKILGIETSCDETAAAVVIDGRTVISSVIASQIDIHAVTGGVVPEVAAREHVLKVRVVIEEAMQKAGLKLTDIDAIAVTRGPGLLSSLLIGYTAAVTLTRVLKIPLIPVHHVAGHIYANWLTASGSDMTVNGSVAPEKIQFPIVALTVSGGHNELVLMKKNLDFQMIGETLDDAAGEAFDKVARLLNLGYPGGPAISKAALKGDPKTIKFPRALVKAGNYNFSFSGLKTAVLREVETFHNTHGSLTESFVNDCAASFQECVADILSEKLIMAAKEFGALEIHLAGGVSANSHLREMVAEKLARKWGMASDDRKNETVSSNNGAHIAFVPTLRFSNVLHYCTDNAAMIAGAAYYYFEKDPKKYTFETAVFPEPQLDLYTC